MYAECNNYDILLFQSLAILMHVLSSNHVMNLAYLNECIHGINIFTCFVIIK